MIPIYLHITSLTSDIFYLVVPVYIVLIYLVIPGYILLIYKINTHALSKDLKILSTLVTLLFTSRLEVLLSVQVKFFWIGSNKKVLKYKQVLQL